jgi:hypothetical protein
MPSIFYSVIWFMWAMWTMTLCLRAPTIAEFIVSEDLGPTEVSYRETLSLCFYPVVTILWVASNIVQFGVLE